MIVTSTRSARLTGMLSAYQCSCLHDPTCLSGSLCAIETHPVIHAHMQIATVLEFVGAVSLGGSVTSTVKGGITRPSAFKEEPQVRIKL